jgi:tetratricopeptide (TPR) repeat protein
MLKKLLFLFLLSAPCKLLCQKINPFLDAYNKIVDGDTSLFRELAKSKDAGSNYAYYMCKARFFHGTEQRAAAFALYSKAVEIANSNYDKAVANIKLGNYYLRNSLLIPALESYLKAEKLYSFHEDELEYIELNKQIGLIYSYSGKHQKSIERFLKICNATQEKQYAKTWSNSANNIAVSYLELKDFKNAEKYIKLSLQKRKEINDSLGIAQSTNNLGTLFYATGDYASALRFFESGLSLRMRIRTGFSAVSESEINIGKTYIKLNRLDEAQKMLEQAFEKGKKVNQLKYLQLSSFYLMTLYELKKDHKKAFEMQKLHYEMKDSIYNYDKIDEINRISLENEFKGKIVADSLTLLKQENVIRTKENRNKQTRQLMIGLVLILGLVLFFVFNLSRQKKREQLKNKLISEQSERLSEQNTEIKASIHYAKRIQTALMSNENYIGRNLGRLMKK